MATITPDIPAWKLVITFPAVWDDYAVNSEYFAYKSNGTYPRHLQPTPS